MPNHIKKRAVLSRPFLTIDKGLLGAVDTSQACNMPEWRGAGCILLLTWLAHASFFPHLKSYPQSRTCLLFRGFPMSHPERRMNGGLGLGSGRAAIFSGGYGQSRSQFSHTELPP
jgi:hypothetical protein